MLSMRERCKSRQTFSGTKVCKAKVVRKYFVNPKIENDVFGSCVNYVVCSLDFRNTEAVACRRFCIACTKTTVIESFLGTYWLSSAYFILLRMCLFLSISCFFRFFLFLTFMDSTTC